jgi:hypothetical protein
MWKEFSMLQLSLFRSWSGLSKEKLTSLYDLPLIPCEYMFILIGTNNDQRQTLTFIFLYFVSCFRHIQTFNQEKNTSTYMWNIFNDIWGTFFFAEKNHLMGQLFTKLSSYFIFKIQSKGRTPFEKTFSHLFRPKSAGRKTSDALWHSFFLKMLQFLCAKYCISSDHNWGSLQYIVTRLGFSVAEALSLLRLLRIPVLLYWK